MITTLTFPVELVEVRESWPGHHNHKKGDVQKIRYYLAKVIMVLNEVLL